MNTRGGVDSFRRACMLEIFLLDAMNYRLRVKDVMLKDVEGKRVQVKCSNRLVCEAESNNIATAMPLYTENGTRILQTTEQNNHKFNRNLTYILE
jgi:hypothetical protein